MKDELVWLIPYAAAAILVVCAGIADDVLKQRERRASEAYCLDLAKAGQDITQIPKCMEK